MCNIEGHTIFARDLSPDAVVLDLGATRGRFAHEVIRRFRCRCYSVEPSPELYRRIDPHPNLSVFNVAVAGATGEVTLRIAANCEESSILETDEAGVTDTVRVRGVRLDDLLREIGVTRVDLIKFDIEGAEIQVLDSCSDEFLRRVPQLTIEFHGFLGLTPVATVEAVVDRLRRVGFFPVKMWRRGYGDTLFINRRLSSASYLECLWTRYVVRNLWGVQRVVGRQFGQKPAPNHPSHVGDRGA